MKDSNRKLLKAVADIAYLAGQQQYYSGDSRADMTDFLWWAQEFEDLNENTDWGQKDYILAVEHFAMMKLEHAKVYSSNV